MTSIESLEVFWEFNRSAHHCILSLDALTRHDGFDSARVKALAADMNRAKAAANAYLISVIGAAESATALSSTTKRETTMKSEKGYPSGKVL